jgi:hypothetical protein
MVEGSSIYTRIVNLDGYKIIPVPISMGINKPKIGLESKSINYVSNECSLKCDPVHIHSIINCIQVHPIQVVATYVYPTSNWT